MMMIRKKKVRFELGVRLKKKNIECCIEIEIIALKKKSNFELELKANTCRNGRFGNLEINYIK